MKKNRSGFTLLELMAVVIIVGILAAVGMNKMSFTRKRAMAAEALTGCGVIKHHLELLDVESRLGEVAAGDDMATLDNGAFSGDLRGTWFSPECYTLTTFNGMEDWLITVTGDNSTSGAKDAVAGMVVTFNSAGENTISW